MTASTLTRVLSGLEKIASQLEAAEAQSVTFIEVHGWTTRDGSFKTLAAFGYLKAVTELAAENLRKDIKLLRDNLSLGG